MMIKGIGVSPGISIGKAYVIKKDEVIVNGLQLKNDDEISVEIIHFEQAIDFAIAEIELIKADTELGLSDQEIAILETQIELISDPQIRADVLDNISKKRTANDALIVVVSSIIQLFLSMDDEYMRARAADIQDISNRILRHLNKSGSRSDQFEPNTIIIARDISPSDTIMMDINHVVGFATQSGGKTSHTAIIAKSKGIPAVVGCGAELESVQNNDILILDGIKGILHVNPSQDILADYTLKRDNYKQQVQKLRGLRDVPAMTTDNKKITLQANISGPDDMADVLEEGGEGVGLLRTEMLFMNRNSFPSEEEQFNFYKQVALQSKGKPVIVRTIDIGGDKQLSYFNIPAEENPFMGYRAIRICLDRKELFITQLRAILRAGVFGTLKIMFPMICNVQEVRAAKMILSEAKADLRREGVNFDDTIKTGIMIEIPSAAMTADMLAKEVDFFSIGTNDLCQYTLAVDRMNQKITDLYDPYNPGLLRLISYVITEGHKNMIHVGMCGEMASDPTATLLLLGMGLTEFSMSASSIPTIKNIITQNSMQTAISTYNAVMEMDSSTDIKAYLSQK